MVVTGGNHAGEFLRLLGNGAEFGSTAAVRLPGAAGGIAEALGLSESFVDGDKVVVMLGDNILERSHRAVRRELPGPDRRAARLLLKGWRTRATCATSACPIFGRDGRVVLIREKPETPPSRTR